MGWKYRGNLRGPKGLPATSAAEDDAAVAEFVATDTTETRREVDRVVRGALGGALAGLRNVRPDLLTKWRAALARQAGGGAAARITVSGDSVAWGAGSGGLFLLSSWPGRMQRLFDKEYGKQGTGMMPLWWDLGTSGPGSNNWIFTFAGSISNPVYGIYGPGAKRITKTGTSSYIEFGPVWCDTIRVYCISEGGVARAVRDGVAGGTFRTNVGSLGETYPMLPGFAAGGGNGQVVTDIPMGALGMHTLRIYPEGSDGSTMTVVAMEARVAGSGVAVSNVALSSQTTQQLVMDDAVSGQAGMSISFDASRSDLHILPWGINDWQNHYPVADFKGRMLTAIRRARTSAPVANGGTPSNGDVLLVVPHRPDLASWPSDHGNTPNFDLYRQALHELSDAEGVPLIDFSELYPDFSAWDAEGYSYDGLHLSPLGSEAYARTIYQVLTNV